MKPQSLEPSDRSNKSQDLLVAGLLVLIVLLGLYFRFRMYQTIGARPLVGDENEYFRLGVEIKKIGLWQFLFTKDSLRTGVGFPLFLSWFQGFAEPIKAARLGSVLMSALVPLLAFVLGKQTISRKAGLLAALLCAVYPSFVESAPSVLSETVFIPLFLLFIICSVSAYKSKKASLWFLAGILLALLTLTRPVVQLLPFFWIGLAILFRRRKETFFRLGIMLFAFLLLVVPMLVKNIVYLDRSSLTNGSGAVLWLGSWAPTEGDDPPYRGYTYDTINNLVKPYSHLDTEGDKILIKAAVKQIEADPVGYAYWSFKKIGRLTVGNTPSWFFPERTLKAFYHAHGKIETLKLMFQIGYRSAVVIIGLFGLLYFRKRKGVWLVASILFYFIMIHTPFLAIPRYGYPAFPIFAVMAAGLLLEVFSWITSSRSRNTSAGSIMTFGVLPVLSTLAVILYVSFAR